MNLQNELQSYAEKHGLSMSKIAHARGAIECDKYPNHFPVCRKIAYSAYLGKPISGNTYAKLFLFFTQLNDKNNENRNKK